MIFVISKNFLPILLIRKIIGICKMLPSSEYHLIMEISLR
ncbi:hypothetical protein A1OE_377 [Candidatus Endolissoclinum faulkneri L2]|uniref:Uncharacterized protein n=1 Tax=Candidatus Endolissoclinum faulkneri L2 TaxID=1193729 RepID=K7YM45_9PROT|nr:hypothetical protein A1OE_377 [Candidatus Endolissoclinum faulkneri L2]